VTDTIREQIISVYVDRLTAWITANGYNYGCGANVFRAEPVLNFSEIPACTLWPDQEEAVRKYGKMVCTMPLKVEAIAELGSINPSVTQEKLLGDAIKIMTDPDPYLALIFGSGGYTSAVTGDIGKTVVGTTSGDTGTLVRYDNDTRQWVIDTDGDFDPVEAVTITDGTGAGTLSKVGSPAPLTTLIDSITYIRGGPVAVPKGEDTTAAVSAEFEVKYKFVLGNPETQ
jgi:hypothetical protein